MALGQMTTQYFIPSGLYGAVLASNAAITARNITELLRRCLPADQAPAACYFSGTADAIDEATCFCESRDTTYSQYDYEVRRWTKRR